MSDEPKKWLIVSRESSLIVAVFAISQADIVARLPIVVPRTHA